MSTTASITIPDAACPAASGSITVACAPAGHPYVAKVTASPGVVVLPDPPVPGAERGRWWPPVILDPAWITAHRQKAQLLHIHFGTESFPPGRMTAVLAAAHDAGWPVVYTAHDLQHPQLVDQSAHLAQLGELIGGADAVITLTSGAADVIRQRWNREAVVIPHPSLLTADAVAPRVRPSDDLRIGVHLKDLRPNVDGPGTVRELLAATALLRSAGMRAAAEVRLHHRVRDEAAREAVRHLCRADPHAMLIEHERLSDAELVTALSRLDACFLPYRHGTHSGWLELCWDLGVPVVAPDVGFYGQQHQDGSICAYTGGAPALAAAIAAVTGAASATRAGTPARADLIALRQTLRRETDAAAAAAHAALYRRLIAEGPR